jgi:adhesin transport system outer membrane protein
MKSAKLMQHRYLAHLVLTVCAHAVVFPLQAVAQAPKKSVQLVPVPIRQDIQGAQLLPMKPGAPPAAKASEVQLPTAESKPETSPAPQALAPMAVDAQWVQQAGLSLSQLLQAAADSYPTLIAARTETRATSQDVTATERLRWPTLTATMESDSGNLRSYPNKAVQVDQTLWDAGRNSARINEAKVVAEISLVKVYLQQQEVFLQIVNAWQNMIAARERLKVAERTLKRLQGYQQQMRRRVQAEASPVIDLELVDSRLLQTDVELSAAKTSFQVAITRLAQFSGEEDLAQRAASVYYAESLAQTDMFADDINRMDWFQLAAAHPSVVKARHEVNQAKERLQAKNAEAFPQVFARIYKPLSGIPNNPDTSTTAFIGLRYTPGAGFATLVEAQAMGTRVTSSEQAVQAAMRDVQQIFENDREEFTNSRSRMSALIKSVQGSEKVLESYQRQFQAGRKSWLDLLNAVRELAQNEYALADAKAGMVAAMNRLQIRLGLDPQ